MAETRILADSSSFPAVADTWAKSRGILDAGGNLTAVFPVIIGVLANATDLGAFNLGIIGNNRTIKQAFQDTENALNTRMITSRNLSDLTNKAQARTNLELGSSVTYSVGTSGAVLPLLNTANTWTGKQTFTAGAEAGQTIWIVSPINTGGGLVFTSGNNNRWVLGKTSEAETGNNAGSNFFINRYNEAGVNIDTPFRISRDTGQVFLSQPLPVGSGGTGTTSLTTFKTSISLNNVDNTSDVNKPISTATQNALNTKMDKSGAVMTGNLYINNTAPTIFLQDSDNRSAMIRVDSGILYVLRGNGNNSTTWDTINGNSPLAINLDNGSIDTAGPLTIRGTFTAFMSGYASFRGSGNRYTGLSIGNSFGSSSATASNVIDFNNETGVPFISIQSHLNPDGGSYLQFFTTTTGSRNIDRRTLVMGIDNSSATFYVPINGNAYPRRMDGQNVVFNWNGKAGQPQWLWGGDDGINYFVYNPSSFSVAYAANAGQLNGISGGDGGGYVRRSTTDSSNPPKSGSIIIAGDSASDYAFSPALQVREVNRVGGSQTGLNWSPGITFHWAGLAASSIRTDTVGNFFFLAQGGDVGYKSIYAADHYATGWFRVKGNNGIYWDDRNRGLTVSDAGSSYGTVNVAGAGNNGWHGYAINNWLIMMANGSTGSSGRGFYSPENGSWLLQWDGSNNAVFPGNITAFSDERLKQNKRPIDNLEKRLRGLAASAIKYERGGVTRIGYGAQTLEKDNPEFVFTSDDLPGTKHVNYGDTSAILAAGVDLLLNKVEALRAENTSMKQLIIDLSYRLDKAGL